MLGLRFLVMAGALALAACGGDKNEAASEAATDMERAGDVASATAGAMTGMVSTDDLPDFVVMMPGGTPVMHMKSSEGDTRGGVFTYTVEAPIAEVVAFHRSATQKAGIPISMEMAGADTMTFGGSNKDEKKQLVTTISGQVEGEVSVSLTYSLPA
jgi:hypothetical protein